MGIKKAKTKEVKSLTAGELGIERSSSYEVVAVSLPQRSKQTQMLASVAELVEKLKNEVHVL